MHLCKEDIQMINMPMKKMLNITSYYRNVKKSNQKKKKNLQ